MPLTYLFLITLRRRHIHDFFLRLRSILLTPDSCLLTPLQADACLAWIKLRHPIVVPQHAVAQVRQHHRHRDLRVHLCQPTGEPAYIAIAVLELSQSEQKLILRRIEGQRCRAVYKLMLCSLEYRLAVLILNGDRLLFCINLCADVLALHFVVLHIQPVRQDIGFGVVRRILDAHGIPCHLTHFQSSLSEGCLCHHHHTDAQQDS